MSPATPADIGSTADRIVAGLMAYDLAQEYRAAGDTRRWRRLLQIAALCGNADAEIELAAVTGAQHTHQ